MSQTVTDDHQGLDQFESRTRKIFVVWLPLLVFLFVLLFPFYWMTITAVKPNNQLTDYQNHSPFWVVGPTLQHVKYLLFETSYPGWLWNTLVVAVAVALIVAAGSELAVRDQVAVTELADHDWISVEGGFPVDDVLLSISAATGVAPRVTQRMLDFTTIEALVAHGHGIALMPRFAVRHPGVKRLVLKGVRAARVYEALARPRSRAAVQQVVDHLRAVGAEQG